MDASSDLTKALGLLGLSSVPGTTDELARLVVSRHPASVVWTSEETWAYRQVWRNLGAA